MAMPTMKIVLAPVELYAKITFVILMQFFYEQIEAWFSENSFSKSTNSVCVSTQATVSRDSCCGDSPLSLSPYNSVVEECVDGEIQAISCPAPKTSPNGNDCAILVAESFTQTAFLNGGWLGSQQDYQLIYDGEKGEV